MAGDETSGTASRCCRELGGDGDGGFLPFAALTAIHMAHRLGAFVLLPALAAPRLAPGRERPGRCAAAGRSRSPASLPGRLASGLGNVVLGWPLVAAVAHTAGAAALVVVLTFLIVRAAAGSRRGNGLDAGPTPGFVE